jgi:hypothetical protein
MKLWSFVVGAVIASALALAGAASAKSFDVCVNPTVDARFDMTGTFFTATAPIYPGGTIAQSSTTIDCGTITASRIGTFFTVGALVARLPASATNDTAMATWHFRLAQGAFDTIGPVEGNGAGGATPGQTYPQTIVGATGGSAPAEGQAMVTVLDPTGFVFEIMLPG